MSEEITQGLTHMSGLPQNLPTSAAAETFGGVTYHLDGELVPVLTVDVSARPVYFEHHILLFIDKFPSHAGDGILWLAMETCLKRYWGRARSWISNQADGAIKIHPFAWRR